MLWEHGLRSLYKDNPGLSKKFHQSPPTIFYPLSQQTVTLHITSG